MREIDLPSLITEDACNKADTYRKLSRTCMLTITFSDVVGYTALCENRAEPAVRESLRNLEAIAEFVIEEEGGGRILKWIGDAVLSAFADPVSAVNATVGLHRRVSRERLFGTTVQLRSGIHTGLVAIERKGFEVDVFGRHVNRAARVQTAAEPDEILVTDVVEDNVGSWMRENKLNLSFCQSRQLRLKGIERPVTVHRVGVADAVPEARVAAINQLQRDMLHADSQVRKRAALRIGARGMAELLDSLCTAMLGDASSEVREAAAWGVDQLKTPDAIPALVRAIHDESSAVRANAGWALVHIGGIVTESVHDVVRHSTAEPAKEMAHLILERVIAREPRIRISVENNNVLGVPGEVLALKYAQALTGVEQVVVEHLAARGIHILSDPPGPSEYFYYDGPSGSLAANALLFVGVPSLFELKVEDIRDFSCNVLAFLSQCSPAASDVLVTLPHPHTLRELELVESQISGFTMAIDAGNCPRTLERIRIFNTNPSMVALYESVLQRVSPDGFYPPRNAPDD